jgi:hypothetical protein
MGLTGAGIVASHRTIRCDCTIRMLSKERLVSLGRLALIVDARIHQIDADSIIHLRRLDH